MSISANVHYNEDNERTSINVNGKRAVGLNAHFTVENSTALLTSVEPVQGETCIYGDNLQYVMDYVSDLPFVDTVLLDEYEDHEA